MCRSRWPSWPTRRSGRGVIRDRDTCIEHMFDAGSPCASAAPAQLRRPVHTALRSHLLRPRPGDDRRVAQGLRDHRDRCGQVPGGELLGTFQTLVDPGLPIPPSITILTGITEAMVVAAPDIATAPPHLPRVHRQLGHRRAQHPLRPLLPERRAASSATPRCPTTRSIPRRLARRLVREEVRNMRLQTLAAHFRSPVAPIHRALDDARATAHVLHDCWSGRAASA